MYHLILLAENDTGYHNLMKIVSIGQLEGFYYKPRVDKDVLRTYHEGVICLSACVAGEVPQMICRTTWREHVAAFRNISIFWQGKLLFGNSGP